MSALSSLSHPCVLLVKTDEKFTQQAILDLAELGYLGIKVHQIDQVFELFDKNQPELLIIDRSLAGKSSDQICIKLRQMGHRIPILLLVEKDTLEERVACLEMGADDFLLNIYQKEKFVQFIQLYLKPVTNETEQLHYGDLILDLNTRCVIRDGKRIDLTMKEFELLKYLISHPQEVLTREQILENVWGYDFEGESNVIEVYIRYLRLKIEDESHKRLIQTVRGVGYVLRES
jgi:two-component system, OmpR family, response regulator NblR